MAATLLRSGYVGQIDWKARAEYQRRIQLVNWKAGTWKEKVWESSGLLDGLKGCKKSNIAQILESPNSQRINEEI